MFKDFQYNSDELVDLVDTNCLNKNSSIIKQTIIVNPPAKKFKKVESKVSQKSNFKSPVESTIKIDKLKWSINKSIKVQIKSIGSKPLKQTDLIINQQIKNETFKKDNVKKAVSLPIENKLNSMNTMNRGKSANLLENKLAKQHKQLNSFNEYVRQMISLSTNGNIIKSTYKRTVSSTNK